MATLQKRVSSIRTGRSELVDMTPEEQAALEACWAECAAAEKNRVSGALRMVQQVLADPAALAALKEALK